MRQIAFALLQNMRPKQWAKNGFVFAGIVFDQQLDDREPLLRVLVAFVLLCLTSSTIYLINDLADVESDRQHPKKKFRPIASGRLPMRVAAAAAIIFPSIAIGGAMTFSPELAGVLVLYLVLHILYSYLLKHIAIVDVFTIAAGFVLRVIAGVVVIEVEQFSPWLYVMAGLVALFLTVGKRRQELIQMGDNATNTRAIFKDYNLPLLDDMLRLTMTSTAVAYTLYVIEAETLLVDTEYRLLTVPFVYYGLFRYLHVLYVKNHGGDPTEVIYEDRPLQVALVLGIALVLALLYIF
jgi:4-hydroxybenzoate polyprenyltransferase